VVAGTVLGLVGGVFAHEGFSIFLPLLWIGEEPVSILAMLVTACVVPSGVALPQLEWWNPPKASA